MKRIKLYYFSGTGNSLKVCKDLKLELEKKTEVEVEIQSMTKLILSKSRIIINKEITGLVFPVYCSDVPRIVREFVNKMAINIKNPYFFSVVTRGGSKENDFGNCFFTINKLLKAKQADLGAGYSLRMPESSIIIENPIEKHKQFLQASEARVKEIAKVILVKKRENFKAKNRFNYIKAVLGNCAWTIMKVWFRVNKKEVMADKCNNCGVCEKVCPMQNISRSQGKVHFGKKCEQCFACFHWCPQKAVKIGILKAGKKYQYKAPNITIKEIGNSIR